MKASYGSSRRDGPLASGSSVYSTGAVGGDVDMEAVESSRSSLLGARGEGYQAAPPGTRILYVNDQTESSSASSFVVCSETYQRRTFSPSHVMSVLAILLMATFVLAVAMTKSSGVGCSGLDCLFESTGIVAQTINTSNGTTPAVP